MEFDPSKDEENVAKHGISLARASDMDLKVVLPDERKDYGEVRYRGFGLIDGKAYSLAFTIRSDPDRCDQSVYAAPTARSSSGMSKHPKPRASDSDNPEWTEADFRAAKPADQGLPPEIVAQFRNTRGAQRAVKKVPVSLRLSPDVVSHFKASGPGWQTRIDETLKRAISK
ncbi:BrnA antitoxin family protein [Aurantimonas marina]|uniref:BrnA antitoxin family protein n=1 Tax=Aurantimonas marina TaxID=2780508 RepID=UPI002FCDD84A